MREPAEQQPLTALNAAAQQPLTAVNAVPHLPPQVNFIAQALPAARTEPTEPPNMVRSVVLAALATVGLGPLAANGPVLPADSPVGWALLAVGARRFGQPAIQETRNLPAIPTMTSQSIDGAATSTAIASPAATVNSVSAYLSSTYLENQASIGVGTKPSGVVVSPDGQRLYVANTGSGTVSVIDTATGRRIDASPSIFSTDIKVGSSPSGLALSPDGNRLYVANTGSGTVSVITTDTYKLIDTNTGASGIQSISVGSSPSALTLTPDGKRLYVANSSDNTVSVIDTSTNRLIDTNPNVTGTQSIAVGSSPSALASGPDGRLYVANTGSNTVSVINTSYSVTNTIAVGSQPASVALGADGRLYVANTGSSTVSVIDTATNTVIDTNPNTLGNNAIPVGPSPTSVALSPDGGLAYVANGSDTVSR